MSSALVFVRRTEDSELLLTLSSLTMLLRTDVRLEGDRVAVAPHGEHEQPHRAPGSGEEVTEGGAVPKEGVLAAPGPSDVAVEPELTPGGVVVSGCVVTAGGSVVVTVAGKQVP